MVKCTLIGGCLACFSLLAQDVAPDKVFTVAAGTHVPLSMITSASTKHSRAGDRIYMETVFPILSSGRIVIPPGSFVSGTVTEIKRPGRVKGRGELFVRFDSLTLANGTTRDFRARVGGIDARGGEELDRKEGKIIGEGHKAGDARTVAETAAAGASIGVIAGAAAKNAALGAGVGSAAGAAAGLAGVLLTRGPEATLGRGSTIEMVLDRPLTFSEPELVVGLQPSGHFSDGPGPQQRAPAGGLTRRIP